MKPQEYWGDPKLAPKWIRNRMFYSKNEQRYPKQEELVQVMLPKEFEKIADNINGILEVGAGDGRLIGALAKKYKKKKCCSVDVNSVLSKYVAKKHKINTYVGDVTERLPFEDNDFDFVYTFQVLQHVMPEDIDNALIELKRIAKKELWLIEGWGDLQKWGVLNGHKRHGAGGGTFYWNIDELVECKETKFLNKNVGQAINNKLYKVKI